MYLWIFQGVIPGIAFRGFDSEFCQNPIKPKVWPIVFSNVNMASKPLIFLRLVTTHPIESLDSSK